MIIIPNLKYLDALSTSLKNIVPAIRKPSHVYAFMN